MIGKGWPENKGRFKPPTSRNSNGKRKRELWALYGGLCAYCLNPVKIDECVTEHVVPRSRGGPDNWDNIALSCIECDKQKGSHTGLEFMYFDNQRLG